MVLKALLKHVPHIKTVGHYECIPKTAFISLKAKNIIFTSMDTIYRFNQIFICCLIAAFTRRLVTNRINVGTRMLESKLFLLGFMDWELENNCTYIIAWQDYCMQIVEMATGKDWIIKLIELAEMMKLTSLGREKREGYYFFFKKTGKYIQIFCWKKRKMGFGI